MKTLTRFLFAVPMILSAYTLYTLFSSASLPGIQDLLASLAPPHRRSLMAAFVTAAALLGLYLTGAAGVMLFREWARKLLVWLPVGALFAAWGTSVIFEPAAAKDPRLVSIALQLVRLYAAVFTASAVYLLLPAVRGLFERK